MIFLRRAIALPFILLFPIVLLLSLFVLRVNATILEPGFYTGTLERVDAYNFLYDEALPYAVRESGIDLAQDVPLGIDLTPEGISAYVRRVLPPAWLEQNISGVIDQVVPYASGKTDTFTVTVRLDDRVDAAAAVLQEIIADADVHSFLINEIVRPELERNETAFQDLPFGLRLTPDQIAAGITEVVPEDWLKTQVLGVLDGVVPYLTADTDNFSVVIPLQERADAGVAVLEEWLLGSLDGGAYDYLMQEQVGPMVSSAVGAGISLPYGVIVTEAEILDAIAAVVPQSWVAERITEVVDVLGAYLTGRSDTLVVNVSIVDRVELAAVVLAGVVDTKLEAAYDALPLCMALPPTNTLPNCRIPGVSYQVAKSFAGYDVEEAVTNAMLAAVPHQITLTERDLLGGLGTDNIERVRTLLRDGWEFSDEGLRRVLGEQGGAELVTAFENMRGYMRDGFVFTDADLRAQTGADFQQYDAVRERVGTARSFAFLLLFPPILLAAIVGFLGGRGWGGRLMWAGIPLLIGGVIVAAASGIVAGPLRDLTEPFIRDIDADQAMLAKIIEVRDALVSAFITPLGIQAGVTALLGVAAIVGGIYLGRRQAAGLPSDNDGILALPPLAAGR